jgi:hypothetical protein
LGGRPARRACRLAKLADLPRLLFAEPNPASVKYWLWRLGLIDSAELRLPMTPVSEGLAALIDREIALKRRADCAKPRVDAERQPSSRELSSSVHPGFALVMPIQGVTGGCHGPHRVFFL